MRSATLGRVILTTRHVLDGGRAQSDVRRRSWLAVFAFAVLACSPARPAADAQPSEVVRVAPAARDAGSLVAHTEELHAATREDCLAIVDVNIELQMKEMGIEDAAVVDARKKDMRVQLETDIEKCIGRKVSTSALDCVRSARAVADIDRCLR